MRICSEAKYKWNKGYSKLLSWNTGESTQAKRTYSAFASKPVNEISRKARITKAVEDLSRGNINAEELTDILRRNSVEVDDKTVSRHNV